MLYFSISMSYFVVWILNYEFIRRECGFSINSKISLVNSGNKLILIMKIPATDFWRFRYFADIILILKLHFEAIIVSRGLPSVKLSIIYLYWNFKIFSYYHLLLIIFLDRRQRGPIKLVLLVIIGWLVGWLVMLFSQKQL